MYVGKKAANKHKKSEKKFQFPSQNKLFGPIFDNKKPNNLKIMRAHPTPFNRQFVTLRLTPTRKVS